MSKKDENNSSSKSKKLEIRCTRVFQSNYAPYYYTFEAKILDEGNKKRKRSLFKFRGWLPSFSPAFRYVLLVSDEQDKNIYDVKTILSWERDVWWINDCFIRDTLDGIISKDQLILLTNRIQERPLTCEDDLLIFKNILFMTETFNRHFWPDIWFDLSIMNNGDENDFSSRIMENNCLAIREWQKNINTNFINSFIGNRPFIKQFNRDHLYKIYHSLVKSFKTGGLSQKDISYENSRLALEGFSNEICNTTKKNRFIHPTVPLREPEEPSEIHLKIFDLISDLENKSKYSSDTTWKLNIPDIKMKNEMIDRNLLVKIEVEYWTFPKFLEYSKNILQFLMPFLNDKKIEPKSVLDCLKLRSCLIYTRGYNEFNIIRDIETTMYQDKVLFICPDKDSADGFFNFTDRSVYPEIEIDEKQYNIIIFCISHFFSLEKLSRSIDDLTKKCNIESIKQVFFFGDPEMIDIRGEGNAFSEIMNLGKINTFDLTRKTEFSLLQNDENINIFSDSLRMYRDTSKLEWNDDVQMCDPDKFLDLYNTINKCDPKSYHILCDDYKVIIKMGNLVREPYRTGEL